MLTRLNWEPLAVCCKAPYVLQDSLWLGCNSNALRYQAASCTYASRELSGLTTFHRHHVIITFILFPCTVCDWNILPEVVVRASSPELFGGMIHG